MAPPEQPDAMAGQAPLQSTHLGYNNQRLRLASAKTSSAALHQGAHVTQGTEDDALSGPHGACFRALPPTWKVMLLSDGSVTRHLQLLTGSPVQVECLEMAGIGHAVAGLPPDVELITGPRVQRSVLLRTTTDTGQVPGPPLVYAVSWWDAAVVDKYLTDRAKPIWVSLSQGHVELYREVRTVCHGHNEELVGLLGCPGPFWGRQYLFWHDGEPLTLIYEVFSPQLGVFLGPQDGRGQAL